MISLHSRLFSAGIFVVLILFAIPVWWKTTEVQKVSFPERVLDPWKTLSHTDLVANVTFFPVVCSPNDDFRSGSVSSFSRKLVDKVDRRLDALSKHSAKLFIEDVLHLSLSSCESDSRIEASLAEMIPFSEPNVYAIALLFGEKWAGIDPGRVVLGSTRYGWLPVGSPGDIEKETKTRLKGSVGSVVEGLSRLLRWTGGVMNPSPRQFGSREDESAIPTASHYRLCLTLVSTGRSASEDVWPSVAQSAVHEYMDGILDPLRSMVDVSIETQLVPYVSLPSTANLNGSSAMKAGNSGFSRVPMDMVRSVMSPSDFHLDSPLPPAERSSHSYVPVIHLVMIHVRGGNDSSVSTFPSHSSLVQRWGGVVAGVAPVLGSVEVDRGMNLLASHLRSLIGLPIDSLSFPGRRSKLSIWEIDSVQRRWVFGSCRKGSESLAALAGTREHPGLELLAGAVELAEVARSQAEEVVKSLRRNDLKAAVEHASAARTIAEDAFYYPTLPARSYFPPKHLFAIYTPIVVPVLLPTLLMFRSQWHIFREKRRQKSTRNKVKTQ